MNKQSTMKEFINGVIQTSRFAVLATEGDGQPHASLVAITPVDGFRRLVFATYRNTLKYRNLMNNRKVAVLIEDEHVNMKGLKEKVVLTVIGHTENISKEENQAAFMAHLKRHPQMESFMLSPDCALIQVIARSYQVVYGLDDIMWIPAEDFGSA